MHNTTARIRSVTAFAVLVFVAAAAAQETCKRVRTFAVDPVELLAGRETKGDEAIALSHGMYNYHFVSAASKAAFEKHPDKYEVQLGGACGRMGPLSGYGRGDIYAVHDGRIYLFASKQCRESFLKAPEKLLEGDDAPPKRDAAAEKRGRELIDLAVKHAGGSQIDEIKTYQQRIGRTEKHGDKDYRVVNAMMFAFPDRVRLEEWWDETTYGHVVVGESGFGFANKAVEDMPLVQQQVRAVRRMSNRTPIAILRARTRADFIAIADGSQTVGETSVERVTLYFDGCKMTLLIDPANGRLLGLETRMRAPSMAIGDARITYVEERTVEGVTLPCAWRIEHDGKASDAPPTKLTTIEINAELPAALFEQPKREP
ncbi:MAG: hypothetical protein ACKVS9_16225 [Phycisphaerae bacterium]